MIAAIATMTYMAGHARETRRVLAGLLAPARPEAGCGQYDLHVAADDENAFALNERWTDRAAPDSHRQPHHVTAALARVPELRERAPETRACTLLA